MIVGLVKSEGGLGWELGGGRWDETCIGKFRQRGQRLGWTTVLGWIGTAQGTLTGDGNRPASRYRAGLAVKHVQRASEAHRCALLRTDIPPTAHRLLSNATTPL